MERDLVAELIDDLKANHIAIQRPVSIYSRAIDEIERLRQENEWLRPMWESDLKELEDCTAELANLTAKLAYAAAENKRPEHIYMAQNHPKNTGWTTEEKQS